MMALYTARICFDVAYHADEHEITSPKRAECLADAMLLALRRSTKVRVVAIARGDIQYVEQERE